MAEAIYGVLSGKARAHSAIEAHPEFAAKLGAMIAVFALVERDMPWVVAKLTGMDVSDAFTIVSVFRAFSNRLDVLEELIKGRDPESLERQIATYFKGRFKEANRIRNKYVHASYVGDKDPIYIEPFSSDHNRPSSAEKITLEKLESELDLIRAVAVELYAYSRENRLPEALHKRLFPAHHRAPKS